MEKKKVEMAPRMDRQKSLMEKAEEEVGRYEPQDGEMEESYGES